MNAISVFTTAKPTEKLAVLLTLKESKGGARAVALLPATAKDGKPSIKSITGLKGQALKAYRRQRQDELKTAMSREFAGLASSPDWTGRKLTVSKTGVVGFFLEPATTVVREMSSEEMCETLGISADELAALKLARK
jgi:hypothetical protein